MLSFGQMTILANALYASQDPIVQNALAIRDDVTLTNYVNAPSATDAWKYAMTKEELFEAVNITKFDQLSAGKRDLMRLIMENAPIDFERQKKRNAIVDIWGTNDGATFLQNCVEKATWLEDLFKGQERTTQGVTAWTRTVKGQISLNELSTALNLNPPAQQ